MLAAREAMTNAAKFSGADEISVYAEVGDDAVAVFVRDRGAGFDRAAVASDRRGIAESIEGRMTRAGGHARRSRPSPGDGHRGRADAAERERVVKRVVLVDDHELFRAGVRGELATPSRSSARPARSPRPCR